MGQKPKLKNIIAFGVLLFTLGLTLYLYQKDFNMNKVFSTNNNTGSQGNQLTNSSKEALPESNRSKAIYQKVAPKLSQALRAKGLQLGSPIYIRIFKLNKVLELWVKERSGEYQLFKSYPICYFSGKLGPKFKEGDKQAPEGFYYVNAKRMNPYSKYHLSFNIGFPNEYDRSLSRTGSFIMVHGNCVSIGCYAMTNKLIEEIYVLGESALKNGQSFFRVHIFPFIMSDYNMGRYKGSRWYPFWKNLKEGYDYFEQNKVPPKLVVKNQRYYFENDPNEL